MEIKTKIKQTETYESPINPESLKETRGFAKRFPTIKKRVISILRNDKYARKNYLWLCMLYWAKCGQIKIVVPLEKFNQVNSPESITRAFRKIIQEHEDGMHDFLRYDPVDEMRYDRQCEMRRYFANEK